MSKDPKASEEFESYSSQPVPSLHNRQRLIKPTGLKQKKLNWPVFLFCLGLLWPCVILLGPIRLSVYRIVLLVMILPCLRQFINGRVRMKSPDVIVLLYSLWRAIGLIEVNGIASSSQTMGIELLETIGPYFLARCFIRDASDFYNVTQLLFRLILVLLPFAIVELLTGQNFLRELFAMVCSTVMTHPEHRSGLTRVQSVFDHAILFGVFAASMFALVDLVLGYKKSALQRNLRTGLVAVTAISSLSAGPLTMVVVQGLLLAWNSLLRHVRGRWKILIFLGVIIVPTVQAVANRPLTAIISGYLTFEPQSYYFRVLIWDYGSAAALNNWLFGLGLNLKDWARPNWMGPSIDNFWLYLAIRSGLMAPILLQLALASVFLMLALKKGLDEQIAAYRTALLIVLTALFVVSWTVHFWDTAYVMFLFLIGSGLWILDAESPQRGSPHFHAAKAAHSSGRRSIR
jgi:hypothetical protein